MTNAKTFYLHQQDGVRFSGMTELNVTIRPAKLAGIGRTCFPNPKIELHICFRPAKCPLPKQPVP
jgi:hypothetical protein